jgi:predicted dithiol-disulfide oxidoreductase (DUF899 family)
MIDHKLVSREEWIEARRALLAEEKAWTRERDRLNRQRLALPWVKLDKTYRFKSTEGARTLAELFEGRSQLIVYHFMFGPEWEEGCMGCSLFADHIDSARQHFEHHDMSVVAVSRGPLEKLQAYRRRLGWTFRWVSSADSDFNFDFHVSFPKGTREQGVFYNFEHQPDPGIDELHGTSAFYRECEDIFHTYSTYGRGCEPLVGLFGWLDTAPKGRNEPVKGNMTEWIKRHDRY